MPNLLIKHKIWMGFAILLLILLMNVVISTYNQLRTKETVTALISQSQPMVLAAHQFIGYLANASSALSNYLLTKNDKQRQAYQNAKYQASETLKEIAAMKKVQQSSGLKQTIDGLQQQMKRFDGFEKKMLVLAKSRIKNEPALAYSTEKINPKSLEILGTLATMIGSEADEDLNAERVRWINFQQDLRYNFSKFMNALRLYLNSPAQSNRKNMLDSIEQVKKLTAGLKQFEGLYTFEEEEGVAVVQRDIHQVAGEVQPVIALNEGKKRRMDVFLIDSQIQPLLSKMQNTIDDLVYAETTTMENSSKALLAGVDTGLKAQILLAAAGLILGMIVAFVISRMVTVPLNDTVAALQQAAQGDGDLSRRLEVKSNDELGHLAQAFNRFSEKLQALMLEVTQCSTQLITSADEMNRVVVSTESDIQVQGEQIDQIASAVTSMAQKIQDVAHHTTQAAELAEQTYQNSQEGKKVVNESLQSSQSVASNVDQAAQVINELEADVASIGGVLDVIRGIAEQTNLLALNAAIEAARAGEQGRGFAVVADEVRTLASRTQDSTEEIQDMIHRLQNGSQQAVAVMNDGRHKASEGLEQARLAGESLEKIGTAAESMLGMNRQISNASTEQEQTASQVSHNVTTINQLSAQTVSSSAVLAQNGARVNELALQLQNLMKQFKV